jgi:AcrR family transcriptional regulator
MTHLNPPKQSRSRRTLERLVEASLDILSEDGPSGLTVHSVVDRAGSSVGSFYARFGGKDDLLDYLGERVWQEAQERWNAELAARDWTQEPLADLVTASVGLLIDAQRSRSRYLRALDRADGRQGDAYEAFRAQVRKGLVDLLLSRRSEIRHEAPELAVRVALEAVVGVVDAELQGSEPDPRGTDDLSGPSTSSRPSRARLGREELVAECRSLVLGYLTGDSGAGPEGRVDFFDVWG